MGYDIHITRRAHWADESAKAIAVEAWHDVARGDPSLRHAPENGDAFYASAETDAWFDFADGNVFTKNPDEATFAKAHELTARLRAKVQGDDGEVYLPNGERIGETETRVVTRYPWWLLALCLFSIGCFVVVLLHVLIGG